MINVIMRVTIVEGSKYFDLLRFFNDNIDVSMHRHQAFLPPPKMWPLWPELDSVTCRGKKSNTITTRPPRQVHLILIRHSKEKCRCLTYF